jgi:hypothetical protein
VIAALPHTANHRPVFLNGTLMWVGFYFAPPSVDTPGLSKHAVYEDLITHTVWDDTDRLHVVYEDLVTHTVRSN